MSLRYCQFCPVSKAAEMLGERWTILIVRELLSGTTRFSDFQRGLSRISPTLLTRRLSQLQDSGLVVRKNRPNQRGSEYQLTPAGRELMPVVLGLGRWGMRWARSQMNDDELDVELLMLDFNRRLDRTQLPGGSTIVKFVFTDLARFGHWWIVIEDDQPNELCTNHPGREADIELRASVRTMVEIWAGDTTVRTAKKDSRLQLRGDPTLIRTLGTWLRGSLVAGIKSAARPGAQPRTPR